MKKTERRLRREVIDACRWMNATGLNQGTSGNISVRLGERIIATPSAVPYDRMEPEMLASQRLDGPAEDWAGPLPPTSEWRFHRDILRARPEAGAVVHTHAVHATALAMARRPIPACHYMVAVFGGADVAVAEYATFGTEALSANVLRALEGRNACLMANHGAVAVGPTLQRALWLMVELETLAKQYILSLQIGGPIVLEDARIAETMAGIAGYGAGAKGSTG